MTNIFIKEALEKVKKQYPDKIAKIEKAQQNYEIRDLLLSVWARINPEAVAWKQRDIIPVPKGMETSTGIELAMNMIKLEENRYKRVIYYNDKPYPFKQSAPHKLVDMFMELFYPAEMFFVNMECGGVVLDGKPPLINLIVSLEQKREKHIFFCSQEYTSETGIEPYIGAYDKVLAEQIKYLTWKCEK